MLNWVGQPKPGVEPPAFEARLYDVLFNSPSPGGLDNWLEDLNPESLQVVQGAYASPQLAAAKPGDRQAPGCVSMASHRGGLCMAGAGPLSERAVWG